MPSCEDDAHRSADSGRPLSSNAFDRPSVGGRPDNGPLSRLRFLRRCVVDICALVQPGDDLERLLQLLFRPGTALSGSLALRDDGHEKLPIDGQIAAGWRP
jgi:hypothetical protein